MESSLPLFTRSSVALLLFIYFFLIYSVGGLQALINV